jgi:hypothetical protein
LYGTYTGLRNVYVNSNLTEEETSSIAKEDIKRTDLRMVVILNLGICRM